MRNGKRTSQLSLFLTSWAPPVMTRLLLTLGLLAATLTPLCSPHSAPGTLINTASLLVSGVLPEEWTPVEHQTRLGTIFGRRERTLGLTPHNTHYFAFRGIPYAQPPVGRLRLEDPVETGMFPRGSLNATHYKSACTQYDFHLQLVVGNEDCLYLNVFTPSLPLTPEGAEPGLPVLVFLHGGGFLRRSSHPLGPSRLLAHPLILVTVNYRLGAFGYLSTGDSVLPGNYGALDQIAALRWVNSNIAQFGGDPNRVTVGGFSAGGASAHILTLSPRAKGLMTAAVLMSGSGYCPWAVQHQPRQHAEAVAIKLGCPVASSTQLKSCLTSKLDTQIAVSQASILRYDLWPFPFALVVDAGLRADPVLPAAVETLRPTAPVPVMMGTVPQEGLRLALGIILGAQEPSDAAAVYDEVVVYATSSTWSKSPVQAEGVGRLAESFYYSGQSRRSLNTLLEDLTEHMTDFLISPWVYDLAADLALDNHTVFTYVTTHNPNTYDSASPAFQRAAQLGITTPLLKEGVSHGDDLFLLFTMKELDSQDAEASRLLTALWADFVSTGSPQGGSSWSSVPQWLPLEVGGAVRSYDISLSPSLLSAPHRPRERNFWRQTVTFMEERLAFSSPALHEDRLVLPVSWAVLAAAAAAAAAALVALAVLARP